MNKIIIALLLILTVVLTGCAQTISDVTSNDDLVQETVTIRGEVKSPLKIGDISGYTLEDKNGDEIIVASQSLPAEEDTVTVSGTLKKGLLGMGFYIDVQ